MPNRSPRHGSTVRGTAKGPLLVPTRTAEGPRPAAQPLGLRWAAACLTGLGWWAAVADAAPTAAQALALKPIQAEVDYDLPSGEDIERCRVQAKSGDGSSGWLVLDAGGQTLRRFLDTNGDNRVDQWCYCKGGVEVYRDIDSNYNGKADQYRWLGLAGCRWGLDENEDGRVDRWKSISAEEVTAEVVAALRTSDVPRFTALLLTDSELKSLGLGPRQQQELAEKAADAARRFPEIARQQKSITRDARWLNMGASRPGAVPAGSEGSTRDLIVYDNVSAIAENGTAHAQIVVGTLIQVGSCWRLIDAPAELAEGATGVVGGGYFFRQGAAAASEVAAATEGLSEAVQQLLRELEKVDREIESATDGNAISAGNTRRADLLDQLAQQAESPEARTAWLRQMADGISAAVQAGGYPDGIARLKQQTERLRGSEPGSDLAACMEYRYLSAVYAANLAQPDADYAKIQQQWLASLQQFITDYPKSEDAADAMLQLAVGQEFADETDQAIAWYDRIATGFRGLPIAAKAAGAKRRLESVGKTLDLSGPTLDGKTLTLTSLRGRAVLVHYWATWCEPCKQDLQKLKELQAKYASEGLSLVGINVDSDRETAQRYLQTSPLPWPQLFEPGGLDSRLATELGVLTLPTMILIDKSGAVVNRGIHAAELDAELARQLKKT